MNFADIYDKFFIYFADFFGTKHFFFIFQLVKKSTAIFLVCKHRTGHKGRFCQPIFIMKG